MFFLREEGTENVWLGSMDREVMERLGCAGDWDGTHPFIYLPVGIEQKPNNLGWPLSQHVDYLLLMFPHPFLFCSL